MGSFTVLTEATHPGTLLECAEEFPGGQALLSMARLPTMHIKAGQLEKLQGLAPHL